MVRITSSGTITHCSQGIITAAMPLAAVGDYCEIQTRHDKRIPAEIIATALHACSIAPLEAGHAIGYGDQVRCMGRPLAMKVPSSPFGYLLDGLGRATPLSAEVLSGQETPTFMDITLQNESPSPQERAPLHSQAVTGIRTIDALLPLARGQRIGIFASAGLGKSTLLASMTEHFDCDYCVVALVGERGREVKEFMESLSPQARKKTVIVASTSNELPLMRVKAAQSALAIAEKYRSEGNHVLFIMDSLTRYARSLRDIGLASHEMPVRHGYPSSVFSKLPEFIERAGATHQGAITACYTVLTNQDGTEDPLADEIRSLLDGHFYLSQRIAEQGIRPALDLGRSISRLTSSLLTPEQLCSREVLVQKIIRWQQEKELIQFGADIDDDMRRILDHRDAIIAFLSQHPGEFTDLTTTQRQLNTLLEQLSPMHN